MEQITPSPDQVNELFLVLMGFDEATQSKSPMPLDTTAGMISCYDNEVGITTDLNVHILNRVTTESKQSVYRIFISYYNPDLGRNPYQISISQFMGERLIPQAMGNILQAEGLLREWGIWKA